MKKCDICQAVVSEGGWESHINGKKHRKLCVSAEGTIHVNGFHPDTTEKEVVNYFQRFGKVNKVVLQKDKEMQMGSVEFVNKDVVGVVIGERNHVLKGHRLRILAREFLKNEHKKHDDNINKFLKTSISIILSNVGSINDQIMILPSVVGLSKDDELQREQVRQSLQKVFSVFIPDCQVRLLGSSVNELGMKLCDLNVFIDINNPMHGELQDNEPEVPKEVMAKLSSACSNAWQGRISDKERCELAADLTMLSAANLGSLLCNIVRRFVHGSTMVTANTRSRCPFVKFVHGPTGMNVEITTKNKIALYHSKLIRVFEQLDERVRPLIFAVRTWARLLYLSGSGQTTKLNSYTLNMMAIFFMQNTSPRVLPSIQSLMDRAGAPEMVGGWECGFLDDISQIPPSVNTQSPGELLHEFFVFYSNFDFSNLVICPRTGTAIEKEWLYKRPINRNHGFFKVKAFSVQDPFILCHNIAQNLVDDILPCIYEGFLKGKLITGSNFYRTKKLGSAPWGLIALFDNELTLEEIETKVGRNFEEFGNRSQNRRQEYDSWERPNAGHPGSWEPDARFSGSREPSFGNPGSRQPGFGFPGSRQPDSWQSGSDFPDPRQPRNRFNEPWQPSERFLGSERNRNRQNNNQAGNKQPGNASGPPKTGAAASGQPNTGLTASGKKKKRNRKNPRDRPGNILKRAAELAAGKPTNGPASSGEPNTGLASSEQPNNGLAAAKSYNPEKPTSEEVSTKLPISEEFSSKLPISEEDSTKLLTAMELSTEIAV